MKVIQGPLPGFSGNAHAINAGPIFSRVGPSPPERREERRKNGARTGLENPTIHVCFAPYFIMTRQPRRTVPKEKNSESDLLLPLPRQQIS